MLLILITLLDWWNPIFNSISAFITVFVIEIAPKLLVPIYGAAFIILVVVGVFISLWLLAMFFVGLAKALDWIEKKTQKK